MPELDYGKLAEAIAEKMMAKTLANRSLLSKSEVAEFVGYAPASPTARRMFADPTFPMSFPIVEGGREMWRRIDVENWINAKRQAELNLRLSMRS